jgi:hypothetical protein
MCAVPHIGQGEVVVGRTAVLEVVEVVEGPVGALVVWGLLCVVLILHTLLGPSSSISSRGEKGFSDWG